jgi:hypothetical protein
MTIEVRQMVIRSSVGDEREPRPADAPRASELEQLREELLAEMQALVEMKLRDMSER